MSPTRRRSTRPSARHTWNLLGSPYALSAWVWLLFGVPSLLSTVLLVQQEGTGQWWQYLIFGAAAWAAPVAVLAIFRLLWLTVRPRASRPILTLLTFVLAGFARGLAMPYLEPILGLTSLSDPTVRLISEIMTIAASLAIIAVAVSARLTYRDALAALAANREELLELQMSAAQQFHAQREALVNEAQSILAPILDGLAGSLRTARDAKNLASISERMREAVDEVIRPLSASIADRSPVIERTGHFVPNSRTSTAVRQRVALGQFFQPLSVTAFMVVMTTAALLIVLGLEAMIQAVVLMIVSLIVTLWIARGWTNRLELPARIATLVYCLIHVVAGLLFVFLLNSVHVDVAPSLLAGWLILLAGVALLLIRYQLVEMVRIEVIARQAAVNTELEIALSSLRQQVRVESKRVATILHGPVQTALYAAAIQISRPEGMTQQAVAKVLRGLEAAMQHLEDDGVQRPPLEVFVAEISSVWGSSVEISFTQDAQARDLLAKSPTALACVTEVIREGVNNAIKHAQASSVWIEVFIVDPLLVDVTIRNSGVLGAAGTSPGFGADVLADLTHDWNLTDDGATTTLWASVARDAVE